MRDSGSRRSRGSPAHSLIRYHFGGKAGLVGVLIDWLLFEAYMTMHKGIVRSPSKTSGAG